MQSLLPRALRASALTGAPRLCDTLSWAAPLTLRQNTKPISTVKQSSRHSVRCGGGGLGQGSVRCLGELTRVNDEKIIQPTPEVVLFLAAFAMAPHAPLPRRGANFSRQSVLAAVARIRPTEFGVWGLGGGGPESKCRILATAEPALGAKIKSQRAGSWSQKLQRVDGQTKMIHRQKPGTLKKKGPKGPKGPPMLGARRT